MTTAKHDREVSSPRPVHPKNTRKWCRGKVGIEHMPKCFAYGHGRGAALGIFADWRTLVCTTCGKRLDSWCPWQRETRPTPPWVTF